MIRNTLKKKIAMGLAIVCIASFPGISVNAQENDDMDQIIREHEALIQTLKGKRTEQKEQERKQEELQGKISNLEEQLASLKSSQKELGASREENERAQRTIQALTEQISSMKNELAAQHEQNDRLMQLIEKLEAAELERKEKEKQELAAKQEEERKKKEVEDSRERIRASVGGAYDDGPSFGSNALVNPGPPANLNYTQDAQNAQGNSTVMFSFAPNQLYKIYCRVGFLTDIVLKKGEKISFVGGGDTSAWALDSTTVDGTPHLYIKPTVDTSSTNLIITTNKRSYHILLNTSNSYNPMVKWSYGQEDKLEVLRRQEQDEKNITSPIKGSIDNLNFSYDISGNNSLKPEMVFDDGEKTFLRFKHQPNRIPTIFLKEFGKKEASLASYKIKDNTYILDRLAKEIELRFSEKEAVKIKRRS